MRESTVIQGWIDRGKVEALEETLRTLSSKRFSVVPAGVNERIEATTNSETLNRAVEQLFDIARPEDLPL